MFILISGALFVFAICAVLLAFCLFPDQPEHARPGRSSLKRRPYSSKPRHNRRNTISTK